MRIDEYLDKVSGEIKWQDARRPVREELRAHILERAEEYRTAGEAAEEAEAQAVANMGDAAQTGKELNRLHRPRYDWVLMGALAGLLALGLFHLYSLTYIPKTPTWILMIVFAIIACCLFTFVDYRRLFANKLLSIGLYFIFLAVTFTAGSLNRFAVPEGSSLARDMIVSFCTVGMIFSMGLWVWHIKNPKHFLLFLLAILASAITLIAIPSFSIAVTFIICSWIMSWTVKFKWSWLVMLLASGLILVYALLVLTVYNQISTPFDHYIRIFLQSYTDPTSRGYEMDQARKAISSLNLFGPGNPVAGLSDPIPNADIDYGLVELMRMHGLAAGLAVIGLAGTVLWRIYQMLFRIRDGFGRTVSLGLCTYVTMQIVWSLLINFGILPNLVQSGIPMFSLYWSDPLVLGSVLGILIGLYRRKDIEAPLPAPAASPPPKTSLTA